MENTSGKLAIVVKIYLFFTTSSNSFLMMTHASMLNGLTYQLYVSILQRVPHLAHELYPASGVDDIIDDVRIIRLRVLDLQHEIITLAFDVLHRAHSGNKISDAVAQALQPYDDMPPVGGIF